MKDIEFIGVLLAAFGFALIALDHWQGFFVGVVSCFFLIPYFLHNRMNWLAALQVYFLAFNIVGAFTHV